MPRIFAYVMHRGGVADDSAAEMAAAARKIDPTASPVAILTGWGLPHELHRVGGVNFPRSHGLG